MYIREILKKVVSEGLAKQAGNKQFSVSGKTGTAQISQGKAGYKSGKTKYLVSFCGYFPSENPKYSCIVSIEGPNGYPSGGVQAGSVFSRIAERIYAKHLYKDLAEAKDSTAIFIPDVKNGDLKEAAFILQQLNIASNGSTIPQGKNPVWGKATHTANEAELKKMTTNKKLVPNVKGMGAKDAVYLLESYGLRVKLSGLGKVSAQSIQPGSYIHKGQTISLTLTN